MALLVFLLLLCSRENQRPKGSRANPLVGSATKGPLVLVFTLPLVFPALQQQQENVKTKGGSGANQRVGSSEYPLVFLLLLH
jgi:hypothetical protein